MANDRFYVYYGLYMEAGEDLTFHMNIHHTIVSNISNWAETDKSSLTFA